LGDLLAKGHGGGHRGDGCWERVVGVCMRHEVSVNVILK
jgi:hypothetical protein